MNVVVKFHTSSAPFLAAWQQQLLARPPHNPALYAVMIETMRDWFAKHDGLPPGTTSHPKLDPPRLVARFTSDVWVHFRRKVVPGTRRVEVMVLGVEDSIPLG